MSLNLELRVLMGLHHGARCAVHDGATVGSDATCDIVLSDEGIEPCAGKVVLKPQGWLLNTADTSSEPAILAWNEALRLGHAWVTIAPTDAPWIVPDVVTAIDSEEASPSLEEAASDAGDTENSRRNGLSGTSTLAAPPPLSSKKTFLTWPTLVMLGAVALLVLSAIGLFAVSNSFSPKNGTKTAADDQTLGQITAALERLGLASSVHATLSKAGIVTVSGWVRDKAQYEAVASAMSQIWPMPALRISLESDAITTARAALQRFSVKFDPLYQGNGRLNIVGVASNARERAAALDAVRAQLPGLTVLGNTIELAQQVSDKLAEQLNGLGLSGITLTWQPGHLEVIPPEIDDGQEAKLEAAIEEFNKQYWDLAQLGSIPAAAVADSVPFTIRSIIGGPQPFVVLADGSKLLIGGTYKRYRLVAVESTRIIFEGPRRAIITR